MVSPSFLADVDLSSLKGDKNKVLTDKLVWVITEEVAKKYFTEYNPNREILRLKLGEILRTIKSTGFNQDNS